MSDYDRIQRRRNIIVGIFVLAGLLALVYMVFKFGDLPSAVAEVRSFSVYVQFPSAPGIERNTPVRFAGYQIGRVIAIEPPRIMKDLNTGLQYHQTIVVMAIDKKYQNIPSNVAVKLIKRGLGSSYIELAVDPQKELEAKDPNRPETKYLYDGITVQGSTGMTSEFFPEESQKKLDELATSFKHLIDNTNAILGDPNNQNNIQTGLANLTEATKQATETLKELQKLSASGTEAVASVSSNVDKVSDSLIEASQELSKTSAELCQILEKINSGEGSAGRFISDAALYENLLDASVELQKTLEELKLLIGKTRMEGLRIKLK